MAVIHSYQQRILKKYSIVLYFCKEKQLSNSAQKWTCLGLEVSKDLTGGSWEKFCVMLGQDQCYCLSQRSIYFQFSVLLMAPHVRSSAAMPSWKWFHKITGGAEESDYFLHRMHPSMPQTQRSATMPTSSELVSYCLPGLRFKRRPKKRCKPCTGPKPQSIPLIQVKVYLQLSRSGMNCKPQLLFQSCTLRVYASPQLMRTEEGLQKVWRIGNWQLWKEEPLLFTSL